MRKAKLKSDVFENEVNFIDVIIIEKRCLHGPKRTTIIGRHCDKLDLKWPFGVMVDRISKELRMVAVVVDVAYEAGYAHLLEGFVVEPVDKHN